MTFEEALQRFASATPDPVFVAAFDSIRKGAPGLTDKTCEAIARSIAIKVARIHPEQPTPEGRANGDA